MNHAWFRAVVTIQIVVTSKTSPTHNTLIIGQLLYHYNKKTNNT